MNRKRGLVLNIPVMLVIGGVVITLIGFVNLIWFATGLDSQQSTILIIIGIAVAMAGIISEHHRRPYPP